MLRTRIASSYDGWRGVTVHKVSRFSSRCLVLMATTTMRPNFAPKIPQTLEELGISHALVLDLMLRRLLLEGFCTLESLSKKLKLSVGVLSGVFTHMRQQQMVEIKRMTGNDYNFVLSAAGRALAGER